MAETLTTKGSTTHHFPNRALFEKALHLGLIKEGDVVYVDGVEQLDAVPTKGSENLVSSGAIYDAFEEVYDEIEDVETVAVTTAEVMELWNKIMNEGAVL